MADINFGIAPYHDRFDQNKNRNKVLFRPDRPLQQSELNELQSIAEHNLRRLGDSIFSDGAMQAGMSFSVDDEANTITVEDGLVYLAGKIRPFKKQSIAFTGVGVQRIGVKLVQTIVDHITDPTLLDQTQGVASYLSEGADRLVETIELTLNDDSAPTVYEFSDGSLLLEPTRPEFTLINSTLAQRTYEESGSYQVDGFKMWTEASQTADKLDLLIDRGTAYVMGYRISKPSSTRIAVNKSTAFREVAQETHSYDTAVRKNKIGSSSVKQIKQLVARTESPGGGVLVAKGVTGGRDAVSSTYTSIDRNTVTLWTTSPEVSYVYGIDFTIVEENGIQYVDWALNGAEPTTGASYYMAFEYDRIMVLGVDYTITTEPHGEGLPGWNTYVDFNGMTGAKPKDGGILRINYEYYLSRIDLITLNALGNFTIIEGQPDRVGVVSAPEHNDPLTLKIGTLFVYPNTHISEAINDGVIRLRMEDLQKMKSRLENVEYNQAIQALENQATISDDPLALRGVFADPFIDFSRMDLNLSTIALSLDDASITLAVNAPVDQMKIPQFLENASTATTWGRVVTAPFTETREVHQPLATEAMNVNPYAVYNKLGVIQLNPAADNWIEESKVIINNSPQNRTVRLATDRMYRNAVNSAGGELSYYENTLGLDSNLDWSQSVNGGNKDTLVGVARNVRETSIEFIRERTVAITATNLLPMTDNLYLTFDGIKVPLTPTGTTVAGTTAGTVKSDAEGKVAATFTIPPGVRTGIREVVLQNDTNMALNTYRAQGTNRTIEETISTVHVTVNIYDPLAQSFVLPQDRIVSSFDLYFASKSTTDNVVVQVRGMSEGGFPNQTVYAERLLTPADISISADASVATKVALDDPLMCVGGQSYCLVVITDSNEYTMWIGTLGQNRLDAPDTTIVSQPYVNGVLFSSSNARTWSVHQSSDLKFSVYTAQFAETATVEFDVMEDLNSDMLLLMASYLTPANTGCVWEIKTVSQADADIISIDSVPWQPVANYTEQSTNQKLVGLVKLRATFRASKYISPMLALEDLLFVNFISETQGDYVSRNVNAEDAPFNFVTIAFDAATPPGTTVTPKYSLDGGTVWKSVVAAPTITTQSTDFKRYTYSEEVSPTAVNTQIKFKLELRADNRFVRPSVRRLTAVFKDEI